MMNGHLLVWIQKLAVQHFTLEIKNLFTKAMTFTFTFDLVKASIHTLLSTANHSLNPTNKADF